MAKKGYTTGASLQPTLLFRATPFKSYCEARLYKTQLHNRRKHNGNYSPDIRKREEGKEKNNPKYTKHPSFMPECDGSEEILRKILGPMAGGCGGEDARHT
jgi:hypothetical protein